ncbi:MAG: four-carbon acid sugar kinase family protein [Dehalococcoidia bacterium]
MSCRTRVVVIADDLTGANGTAALLRAAGLQSISLIDRAQSAGFLQTAEALAIDAGTRDLPSDEAYGRVRQLTELVRAAGVPLLGKRIDSTLRGHVGIEIDAALDGYGENALALVVAAVPALGRVTAGGYLLVDGVPLVDAAAAADPWAAPHSSLVAAVLTAQSRHQPVPLSLDDLARGADFVRDRLNEIRRDGVRVVVADATTEAHIEQLAGACRGLPVLPVDPGPFTAALARVQFVSGTPSRQILAVIGSVTQRSHEQMTELLALPGAALATLDAAALCGNGANAEIAEAVWKLSQLSASRLLIITSVHEREAVVDLKLLRAETGLEPGQAARKIAAGLAEVTARYLGSFHSEASGSEHFGAVGGLYTTGGAVTEAVTRRLGAAAIEIERAILPLAVLGRLSGGPYSGLPVLSKGGLIGDHQAAAHCVKALQSVEGGRRHS